MEMQLGVAVSAIHVKTYPFPLLLPSCCIGPHFISGWPIPEGLLCDALGRSSGSLSAWLHYLPPSCASLLVWSDAAVCSWFSPCIEETGFSIVVFLSVLIDSQ